MVRPCCFRQPKLHCARTVSHPVCRKRAEYDRGNPDFASINVQQTEWVRNVSIYIKEAKTFNKNEKGVTMLEYGLIAALVAVVAVTAFTTLGSNISSQFNYIAGKVGTAPAK